MGQMTCLDQDRAGTVASGCLVLMLLLSGESGKDSFSNFGKSHLELDSLIS